MTRGKTLTRQQRLNVGAGLIGCFLFLILARLFFLQTFRYETLHAQSENNRVRIQPIVPKRGVVYDRELRPVVDNRASYTLSVVPAEISGTETPDRLARLLEVGKDELDQRIKKNLVGRFQPVLVKRDLDFTRVAILEEQNELLPGAVYRNDQTRQYSPDLAAECFTGYVGEISSEEMSRHDASIYHPGSIIGKFGVEKYYDRELRGLEGTEYMEITASGQLLGTLDDYPGVAATEGNDLVLTIDLDVQKAAVDAFGEFCCGAAVAIDPRNGEILAMISKPSNDANIFSTVIPDSLWRAILADSTNPLLNRPLDGLYPPGSTYKLVVAGAALELGLIDRQTLFPSSCTGGYRFGNRTFHCWEAGGHGKLAIVGAIEQSCDIYFYQLGYKLGLEEYARFSRACGFGKKTGIDLPQEASGSVPDGEWYDQRYGKGRWSRALILNLAIGQGELLCTPLQLAQFYCGLANNGRVYRPHLLKSVIGPDRRETSFGGELSFTLPFSQATIDILNEGIEAVIQGERGTARGSRIRGTTMAGKTGTAQNPHGEDHSWFVGFAPADAPRIVACVIVENAGHGSVHAAPAVKRIIQTYLNKIGLVDAPLALARME